MTEFERRPSRGRPSQFVRYDVIGPVVTIGTVRIDAAYVAALPGGDITHPTHAVILGEPFYVFSVYLVSAHGPIYGVLDHDCRGQLSRVDGQRFPKVLAWVDHSRAVHLASLPWNLDADFPGDLDSSLVSPQIAAIVRDAAAKFDEDNP